MPPQSTEHPSPHKTRWAWITATLFGIGHLRPGPGTYASVATVLLWFGAAHTLHPSTSTLVAATAAAALLATLLGIPAATIVARESSRKDPSHVVIDEVAGQLVALLALSPTWPHAALSLLLFRLFDILKPPPIRQLEKLPGGTGIVLDDLAAGLLAALSAHLILFLRYR